MRINTLSITLLKLSVLLCLGLALQFASNASSANSLNKHKKIINKMPNASLLLANNVANQSVSIRPQQLLVPASTLKVVTAYLAIKRWGLKHKFHTDFYYKDQVLWIKGFGDPHVTSEEVILMSKALAAKKLGKIKAIKVDNSYFPELRLDGRGDSDNPYDAGNAALVVNFNTVLAKKKNNQVMRGEAFTPITPLARKMAAHLGRDKKRIALSGGRDTAAKYFGEIFSKIHLKRSIPVEVASLPSDLTLTYRHYNSKNLETLLSAMLKYSNNFIANQLFLMLPENTETVATISVEQAQQSYNKQLNKEFLFKGASFADGAGLSRLNKISAQQLIKVLEKFRPWINLLPERHKGVKAKTGTLSDNHSLAGYVKDKAGQWQAFVLLINQKMSKNYRFQVAQALLK